MSNGKQKIVSKDGIEVFLSGIHSERDKCAMSLMLNRPLEKPIYLNMGLHLGKDRIVTLGKIELSTESLFQHTSLVPRQKMHLFPKKPESDSQLDYLEEFSVSEDE